MEGGSGGAKTPVRNPEDASKEELVKQVKRQLLLLQKQKAKCDELTRVAQEHDGVVADLKKQLSRAKTQLSEFEALREAYASLQASQEQQLLSFQELERELTEERQSVAKWRRQYHECVEQLDCTESKMAALEQETQCVQKELKRLMDENSELKTQLAHKDSEVEAKLNELQQERDALKIQLKTVVEDSKHEAEVVQKRHLELEKELEQLRGDAQISRENEGDARVSRENEDELRAKLDELTEQHNALLRQATDERNTLAEELSAADQALVQMRNERNEWKSKCENLDRSGSDWKAEFEERIAALIVERDEIKKEFEACCRSLENEKIALSDQLEELLSTKAELENQIDTKVNECNLLKEERQSLETRLDELITAQQNYGDREKEFNRLLDENRSLEKSLQEALVENTRLQEVVSSSQEKTDNLESEKAALLISNAELNVKLTSPDSQLHALETNIAELRETLKIRDATIAKLTLELKLCTNVFTLYL